jgi:uncharacterized membrane protein YfcA
MSGVIKVLAGLCIGVVNVVLGAGGGMLTVPLYKKMGMEQKEAQINAVATILPITIISAIIYLINGNVKISDTYIYLIPGLLGSILGTFVIRKTSNKFLTIFFSIFMIWAGMRLFFK